MTDDARVFIPIPALFSFEECLWFLDRNYDDCLHVIRGGVIFKAIDTENGALLMRICRSGNFLEADILVGPTDGLTKDLVVDYVKEWFDMERSIQPFYDLLQTDDRLAYMVTRYKGLRLIGIANLFEAICWSIIGQQINLSFAYKVKRRMIERFGQKIVFEGEAYYTFPSPDVLAEADPGELREMQFSRQKTEYMKGVARAFRDGDVSKQMLLDLPDFEARKKALIAQKGIGAWTANYALMKSLREPEGIPHGDIGLLQALASHNIIQDRKQQDKIDALFQAFAGWEAYLVFYLWRSLTVKNEEPA